MVRIDDSIRYENVVTKTAYFHYSEMEKELQAFISAINETGAQIKGPLTYALYNVPRDENMLVEFIMPVFDNDVKSADLEFHSYYSVEDMASTYVFNNYDVQMEYAYALLLQFLEQHELENSTPIFHVVDQDGKYVKVMVGY